MVIKSRWRPHAFTRWNSALLMSAHDITASLHAIRAEGGVATSRANTERAGKCVMLPLQFRPAMPNGRTGVRLQGSRRLSVRCPGSD